MDDEPRPGIYWDPAHDMRVCLCRETWPDGSIFWTLHYMMGAFDNGGPVVANDRMGAEWARLMPWQGQAGRGDAAWNEYQAAQVRPNGS